MRFIPVLFFVGLAYAAEECKELHRRPSGCRTYEECHGGLYEPKTCPPGQIFNKAKSDCEVGSCDTVGLATSYLKDKACKTDEADYADCQSYYPCVDGVLSSKPLKCDGSTIFDCEKKTCLPTSMGKCCGCNPGEKVAVKGDCKSYKVCGSDGKLEPKVKKCTWPMKFDPVAKACFYFNVDCNQDRTRECDDGWTAPIDCKRFKRCDRGVVKEDKCGWLRVFEPGKGCHYGSCPSSVGLAITLAAECTGRERRAVANNCRKYEECKNGVFQEEECLMGYYDTVTTTCVAKEKAKCGEPSPTPPPARPCSGKKIISVVGRCDQYDECENNVFVRKNCDFGKRFDALTSKCVAFASAKCNSVQCSIEGERFPGPSCQSYYQCESSKLVLQNCWFYERFDSVSRKCVVPFWKGTCGQQNVPGDCLNGDKRSILGSCTQYLVCNKNTWTTESCGVFKGYDAASKSCKWIGQVNCKARERYFMAVKDTNKDVTEDEEKAIWDSILSEEDKDTTAAPTPAPTPACTEDSREPVDGKCKSFLHCVNGQYVTKTCPTCQNFDPTIKRCVYTWKHPCWDKPTTAAPTTATAGPTTAKPDGPTTTPAPVTTAAPACKEGSKVPDKSNCKNYYECVKGELVAKSCGFFTRYFHPASQDCGWTSKGCFQ